jgi:uncharacterized protein YkwD
MSQSEQTSHAKTRLPRHRLLAAGLAAAALAGAVGGADSALAADCPGADATPMQVNQTTIAGATLCLLNAERRGRALPSLRLSRPLLLAARNHSRDMVRGRYFSHTAPDGSGLLQRVRGSGYLRSARRWSLGENLAWGSPAKGSAAATVRAWMDSPPHRRAVLKPSYRDVGIGVVWGVPSELPNGATYTVDFGVRR